MINIFSKLIRGLLGMLGIIKKTVVYKPSEFSEFVKSLLPGSIIVMGKFKPDPFSDGIKAATNSAYSHTVHYTGMNGGGGGQIHEIVEAIKEGICIRSLDKYNSPDYYMVAFTYDLNPREYEIVKQRIYSRVGEPYDFQGIAHEATPLIPDDPNRQFCSSLEAYAYMVPTIIKNILPKGILPEEGTPGDIFNTCEKDLSCRMTKFNC